MVNSLWPVLFDSEKIDLERIEHEPDDVIESQHGLQDPTHRSQDKPIYIPKSKQPKL